MDNTQVKFLKNNCCSTQKEKSSTVYSWPVLSFLQRRTDFKDFKDHISIQWAKICAFRVKLLHLTLCTLSPFEIRHTYKFQVVTAAWSRSTSVLALFISNHYFQLWFKPNHPAGVRNCAPSILKGLQAIMNVILKGTWLTARQVSQIGITHTSRGSGSSPNYPPWRIQFIVKDKQ